MVVFFFKSHLVLLYMVSAGYPRHDFDMRFSVNPYLAK